MRTRKRKLSDLVDDDRNLDVIASSLERFGQVKPIIVQAGSGRIIAGHGRKAALEQMVATTAEVLDLEVLGSRRPSSRTSKW